MRITVLTVPGCPNAPLAMERVAAALAARRAEVELVEVHDQAQAAEYGMNGSPTILLDGVDPFAPQGWSRACRAACTGTRTAPCPAPRAWPRCARRWTAERSRRIRPRRMTAARREIRSTRSDAAAGGAALRTGGACGRYSRRCCGTSPQPHRAPAGRA